LPQDVSQLDGERDAEIIKIAQSITELSVLFRELSVLVIEQGTVLDRIDYNVEHTLIKVQAGTKELVTADKYSRKGRSIECIIFLILLILVLLLILIAKHSGGGRREATTVIDPLLSPPIVAAETLS
jgi:syntaxin 16